MNMFFVKNKLHFLLSLQIRFLIQRRCSAEAFFKKKNLIEQYKDLELIARQRTLLWGSKII